MQAGQLVRRARWLCLLCEASVSWQLADAPVRRLLVVEGASVARRAMLPQGEPPPPPSGASRERPARQASFDIAAYDRLRVLTTELKRVCAETREPEVRLNDRIVLSGHALARLLELV
jgi:hypothetical protein